MLRGGRHQLRVVAGELVEAGDQVGLGHVVHAGAERQRQLASLLVAFGPQPGDLGPCQRQVGRRGGAGVLSVALARREVRVAGLAGAGGLDGLAHPGGVDEPGGHLGRPSHPGEGDRRAFTGHLLQRGGHPSPFDGGLRPARVNHLVGPRARDLRGRAHRSPSTRRGISRRSAVSSRPARILRRVALAASTSARSCSGRLASRSRITSATRPNASA